MAYIEMESQIDEAMELLDGIKHNEKRIKKSVLGMFGTKAKNAAKRQYSSVLNKKSGYLYKTIRRYVYTNGKAVVVTAHRKDDLNRYGFVLAHGATIEPKEHPVLTFKIGDKWISRHSVTIEPKDFIERPTIRYVNSAQAETDLDEIMRKQLDKLEEKQNKGTTK